MGDDSGRLTFAQQIGPEGQDALAQRGTALAVWGAKSLGVLAQGPGCAVDI
ncbi:hypothetical protein HLH44_09490 [Gluconacetobacter sp. 1c LMG 22058]|uniref:Uncharacterized protein n=1 Tax=Gluconacetobacter dulcium TaxID=2729096 RepID=A0A7W4JZR7_9PROT|nr:hypothetical protein [Gluconacetobacter dulcium]MBB2197689.1 hypothetical protein [Gluconacetobacter dulcium]